LKPNLRKYAAGLLRPAFLKGRLGAFVGKTIEEWGLRLAYAGKVSRWLRENPLEPQFTSRYDLYDHVMGNADLLGPITYLEFGVATGRSIGWWVENNRDESTRFYGFDCFTGLPEEWYWHPKGTFDQDGESPDIDDKRVAWVKGYFQNTLQEFVRSHDLDRRLVVHLDADLFTSTHFVLGSLAPYLKEDDILIFDEFTRLTDATHEFRAFHDFLSAYGMRFSVLGASGGYVQVALKVDTTAGAQVGDAERESPQ
jgi:O-methyltransferase